MKKVLLPECLSVFIIVCLLSLFSVKNVTAQYYPGGLPKSKINIWLDANDASSITLSSGTVTKWTDKVNGLQAISPATANNPVVNASLLSGKSLIEFQGTKVLNIADNPLLDPTNGFNLAQVVYVHPDASTTYTAATDFRIGTYSRNENPNGINNGTASITVKYVIADTKYRLSLQRNISAVVLGNGNASFPDLSGTWNLFENYLTWTGSTDTAIAVQQNANAQISTPYTWYNSTQWVGIGNRYTNYASVHWSIGETVFTGVPLRKAGKNILDIYLAYKWGLQTNLPTTLQNLYSSPSVIFNNNIVGIGYETAVDSINGTGSNNGLGFINVTGINGFLRETGDYLIAGDNALTGTTTIGTGFTRWNRVWFIDKTDTVGYGGNINLFFDFNTYGIANTLDTAANSYYILYNATNSAFSGGTNYLIPVSSYQQIASTKQLSFLVDALNVSNGYYTIIYAPKGTAISTIPSLGIFNTPSINISPAPYISSTYAGNTFNYININTDSIQYSIAYLKIFAGINGSAPVLLDSVLGNTKFYAHYNAINGAVYSYYVKAGYAAGKESNASNIVSLTPGVYAAVWQTQPQYAGSGKIYMMAKQPVTGAPLKYYFQAVSGGGHSYGYTNVSSYTDSLLANGNTYTYQFRMVDSVRGAGTESDWSAPVSIYLADSAKGGFAYKFAFADNSSYAIPNGTGPTNYSPTTIDTTGLRFIRHAPAPYVHPRIYCNPEDSTDIKWRLKNTASGRAVAKYIHAFTTLLQLGYGPGTFSLSANYAKDTLGNQLLSNVGYYNEKPRYDALAAGDTSATQNIANGFGGYANKLANALAYEAFECWLFKGQTDSTTMTSYTTRANRLAKAIAFWAKKALTVNNPPVSFTNRDTYGSLQIAFIYDFLYDQMTTTQRDTVRMFIAALQPTDSSQLHLYNTPSYAIISNWATFGWEIWNILAIEGETGYTQTDDNTLQNYCRTVLNFLNYGMYSQTGAPVEGIGKNQLNVPMLVALAKRGYSMLGHPAIRAFATKYYPAVMQPFGYSMLGTDLLGGTGTLDDFNYLKYVSAAYGGWKHATSLDPIGLKWAYPNDATVDFVWKNYLQKTSAGGPTYNYNYRYQDFLGDAQGHAGYWNFLHAAIFASDYSSTPLLTQAQKIYANNLMYFDSLGGFATLRSGYDTLSSALFFHCRTDLGGHTYGNKNDIVYSALGRIWIPRVFTNANSNAPLSSGTSVASSILINGVGQSVDTTAAQNLNILPVPGKILSFYNKSNAQAIAGDATDAYSYQWSYLFGGYANDNPLLGGAYTKVLKTLNSYRYAKYYNFDDIPLYNKYTQGDYSWNTGPYYYRSVSSPWLNGTIQKAYRTVALVTDNRPYVLTADDVQKDNTVNNYKWIAQIANDLTVDSIVVTTSASGFRNDFILKEPSATGSRRLLVRVLYNKGAVNTNVPVYVDSITNPISSVTPNNKLPRMVIESNSVDPKFKVMLFPYTAGAALPITYWSADSSRLFVLNNGTNKTIQFPLDSFGRTNIIVNDGIIGAVFYNKANTDISVLNNWGTNLDGTGLSPLNFSDTGQTFRIKNNGFLAGSLNLSGQNAKLMLDSSKTFTIKPAGVLTAATQTTIDFQGQNVIIESDNTGTGSVGNIQGQLLNATNVSVQRFITQKRAFRLLASAATTTNYIKNNWQYNFGYAGGYGTHITGAGGLSNGFDATPTNNPSMFVFDIAAQNFNALANTNNTQLQAGKGYLTLIRGDRTLVITGAVPLPTTTKLQATGSLLAGNYTFNSTSTPQALSTVNGAWTLIGNPYASAVSWSALTKNNIASYYYIWDPLLNGTNGKGAYAAYDAVLNTSTAGSNVNNNIQSGQALFVKTSGANPSITFAENNKTTSSNINVFGNTNVDEVNVNVAMYLANDTVAADGLTVVYKNDFNSAVYTVDKFINPDENIAITRNTGLYAMEGRGLNFTTDTIFLQITNLASATYQFSIGVNDYVQKIKNALLIDNYTGKNIALNNNALTKYAFSITIDSASFKRNRFSIVLNAATALNIIDNRNAATAVIDNSKPDVLHISYHQPTNDEVTISMIESSGKTVFMQQLGNRLSGGTTISTKQLTTAVYVVQVILGDKIIAKKIVK